MADDGKLRGKGSAIMADVSPAIARPKPKAAKFVSPVIGEMPPALVAKPTVAAATAVPVAVDMPVATPAPVPAAPIIAEPIVQPTASPNTTETPTPTPEPKKDFPMNETMTNMQNGTADAIKSGAENAMSQGKATLEQMTAKSKDAVEQGMKSLDEMTTMARGNVEALLASTKAATSGLEAIAHQVADFSRKSFEETTAAARAMTTVKTPNELMQLQNDFAKTQFDAAISEMSKLSETLVKLAGEVFEPVQNRVAVATDKLKTAAQTTFNR